LNTNFLTFSGSTDYRLEIFNTARKFRWNVSYSEYVPNAFDLDIDLLRKAPSTFYIAPGAMGELTAIDLIRGQWFLLIQTMVKDLSYTYKASNQVTHFGPEHCPTQPSMSLTCTLDQMTHLPS
jgi:hypothetical protein